MPHPLPVMDPADVVVFGGTGDLAMRKLLPALYLRDRDPGSTTPATATRSTPSCGAPRRAGQAPTPAPTTRSTTASWAGCTT